MGDKSDNKSRTYAFPLLGLEKVQRVDFIIQHGVPLPCYVQKLYELIRFEYSNKINAKIDKSGSSQ
jgi:hypothetical protein